MPEEHLHLARLKKNGDTFEVAIDPDKAMELKEGGDVDLSDAVKDDKVWFDARKGQQASTERLKNLFETDDIEEIQRTIIKQGEVQLSAAYREKRRQELRKQLINYVQRNAVDPKTGYPHPPQRIENAFEEAKVRIVEHKSAEQQLDEVVHKLKPVLPLKMAIKQIEVKLPSSVAAKAYGTVMQYAKIVNESWLNDGSWLGTVELPGGMETEFYEQLNNVCHCEVHTKVIKEK